MRKNSVTLCG